MTTKQESSLSFYSIVQSSSAKFALQDPAYHNQFEIENRNVFQENEKVDLMNKPLPKINRMYTVWEPHTTQLHDETSKIEFFNKKINQKTLTWRSPLIFSPNQKFSPRHVPESVLSSEKSTESHKNENQCEESSSSVRHCNLTLNVKKSFNKERVNKNSFNRKKRDQIQLSDRNSCDDIEHNEHLKKEINDKFSDLCSSSNLQDFGVASIQTRNNYRSQVSNATDYYSPFFSNRSDLQERQVQQNTINQVRNKENYPYVPYKESQVINRKSKICNDSHFMSINSQCICPEYAESKSSVVEPTQNCFQRNQLNYSCCKYDTHMNDDRHKNFHEQEKQRLNRRFTDDSNKHTEPCYHCDESNYFAFSEHQREHSKYLNIECNCNILQLPNDKSNNEIRLPDFDYFNLGSIPNISYERYHNDNISFRTNSRNSIGHQASPDLLKSTTLGDANLKYDHMRKMKRCNYFPSNANVTLYVGEHINTPTIKHDRKIQGVIRNAARENSSTKDHYSQYDRVNPYVDRIPIARPLNAWTTPKQSYPNGNFNNSFSKLNTRNRDFNNYNLINPFELGFDRSISSEEYANHHSSHFSHPNLINNASLYKNRCVNVDNSYNTEMPSQMFQCNQPPYSVINDEDYVMKKFLYSLNPNQ